MLSHLHDEGECVIEQKKTHVSETEPQKPKNTLTAIREQMLLSKSELARKAGVSVLTIDRIEKGMSCRMETKRKIILALGYDLSEKRRIFPEE